MNDLQEKHHDTSRGFTYRYYVSPPSGSSKPAILLLHGWPEKAKFWQLVVPYLAPLKLRIVVPDLLGYGGTSKPIEPEKYNYRLMAEDVMEILDAEKIDKVITVGHDWGCYFCSRINVLYPTRCLATVHIGIAYMPPMTEPVDMKAIEAINMQLLGYPRFEYFKLFTSPDAPHIFSEHLDSVWHALHGDEDKWIYKMFCVPDAMKKFILSDRTNVPLKEWARDIKLQNGWKQSMKTPADWEAAFCWYHAFVNNVQTEEDKKIPAENATLKMPVLHISCDGDDVNPPGLVEYTKQTGLVPNLKVVEMHAGHSVQLERPKEVGEAIVDFVMKRVLSK